MTLQLAKLASGAGFGFVAYSQTFSGYQYFTLVSVVGVPLNVVTMFPFFPDYDKILSLF